MPYLTIENFKAGLDTRRLEEASAPGSLQTLKNAQINRGGEIEKTKAWVETYNLPDDTFGLAASNSALYVFGSISTPSMPVGVTFQQLPSQDGTAMTGLISYDNFSGGLYVVAEFASVSQYHYYNGAVVGDWFEGIVTAAMADNNGIAFYMAALVATDPAVTATSSSAVITISAIVDNLAFDISSSTVNGGAVNNQTLTVVQTQAPGATDEQIDTATVGGTFEPGDKFQIIINNNYYGYTTVTGQIVTSVLTHKNKIYASSGVNLLFSGVAEPTGWKPQDEGAGSIDMSAQTSNDEDLTALGVYQNNLAIFSRNTTQVWSMDPDPDLSVQLQVLGNIGTRAPKTVINFGDSDVFFLSDFGIRSLRARDSSNTAAITDVGTPIDDIIIAAVEDLTDDDLLAACSTIEPNNGRYILSLDDKMYVFSFFPSGKISAWSTWEPGHGFSDFATINGRLYGRYLDDIYLMGGADNDTYTEEQVVVDIPYLDAKAIATWKRWTGLDLVVEGQWDVYVNTNPNQPEEWVKTATVTKTTIGQLKIAMQQSAEMIKFRFVHQGTGAAKISKIVVHYEAVRSG